MGWLGQGPEEEIQGPRFRNQAPRGRSRCRLRARPLGLTELPELKTICTAPFLFGSVESPLSLRLTDQRSTKRGKHTQSKIKIRTPLARQNKLEQTNYRESTHKPGKHLWLSGPLESVADSDTMSSAPLTCSLQPALQHLPANCMDSNTENLRCGEKVD